MDFTWEAKADIIDNWGSTGKGGIVGTFHKGVTYHGIPYRSSWKTATSVGWHVSKQTFMNAANDPDSIFYHNPNTKKTGPDYSLVCSSFGMLVSGFAYPMSNFGMMKDPQNLIEKTDSPVVGSLMTNGTGHCVVPINYTVAPDGSSVYTLAEQVGPLTVLRNLYPGIAKKWKGIGLKSSFLSNYYYRVTPPMFSDIPYDITTYTIKTEVPDHTAEIKASILPQWMCSSTSRILKPRGFTSSSSMLNAAMVFLSIFHRLGNRVIITFPKGQSSTALEPQQEQITLSQEQHLKTAQFMARGQARAISRVPLPIMLSFLNGMIYPRRKSLIKL